MRRIGLGAVGAVALVAGAYAYPAPAARPAGDPVCRAVPGAAHALQWSCATRGTALRAGVVHVDAAAAVHSATAAGALITDTGTVVLTGPNGYRCRLNFPADGTVRSFTCPDAPAGEYVARAYGGVPLRVGVRQ